MIRRAFLLFVGVAVGLVAAGCREAAGPPPGGPPPVFSPEQQKAVDLARAFLAKQRTPWDNPLKVERAVVAYLPEFSGEGAYVVIFATPADEVQVLGERTVLVNINTGRAEFLPRA